MKTNMLWPGFEFSVKQVVDWIDPGGNEPDHDWRAVDANRHGHFWGDGYPTLKWVSVACTMGHGDDCTSEGSYQCRECGEVIRPGSKPAKLFKVEGPRRYTLTVHGPVTVTYAFGQDQFVALQAAVDEQVRSVLDGCMIEMHSG